MGLDMYLTKQQYIGAIYLKEKVKGEITIDEKPIKGIDFNKIDYISENVAQWRKANQIHGWFVDNIQKGEDNCRKNYVKNSKLTELKELCKKVLKTKNTKLLPPKKGSGFGSCEIDDDYYKNLKDTIKIIDNLDLESNFDFYYKSSW